MPSGISVLGLTHTGTAPLTTERRTWSGSRPSTLPLRRNLVYFFSLLGVYSHLQLLRHPPPRPFTLSPPSPLNLLTAWTCPPRHAAKGSSPRSPSFSVSVSLTSSPSPRHGFFCSFEHHFFFIYDFIVIFLLRASQSSSTIGISYIKAVTTIGNSYR